MTQLAIAAKQQNYREHLAGIGVHLPDKATVADIATSLSDTLDRKLALGSKGSGSFNSPFYISRNSVKWFFSPRLAGYRC